jgi:hypothetical protein
MTHWRVTHQISARAYPQILRNRRWLASRSSGELRESATPGDLKPFYPTDPGLPGLLFVGPRLQVAR